MLLKISYILMAVSMTIDIYRAALNYQYTNKEEK